MTLGARVVAAQVIACLAFLPVDPARAEMIGTDRSIGSSSAHAERDAVLRFVRRADVGERLRALGVAQQDAEERVAAMSADDIEGLHRDIDALPAGGMMDLTGTFLSAVAVLAVIAVVVWLVVWNVRERRREAREAATALR